MKAGGVQLFANMRPLCEILLGTHVHIYTLAVILYTTIITYKLLANNEYYAGVGVICSDHMHFYIGIKNFRVSAT